MSEHYVPAPAGNPSGSRWTARCSCGRFVATLPKQREAVKAGAEHVAAERLAAAFAVNSAPSW